MTYCGSASSRGQGERGREREREGERERQRERERERVREGMDDITLEADPRSAAVAVKCGLTYRVVASSGEREGWRSRWRVRCFWMSLVQV